MMKNSMLFATAYPYVTGILAIIWLGSAALLQMGHGLSFNLVLLVDIVITIVIATVGFRR